MISHAPAPLRPVVVVPDYPPFVARFLNLDYSVTQEELAEYFGNKFDVASIRGLDDNMGRKGSATVEFDTRDSLSRALELDGTPFKNGRNLRVLLPERRHEQRGPRREAPPSDGIDRDFDNWDRRGPLPDVGNGGRRGSFGSHKQHPADDRNFENWEHRGPLPDLPEGERPYGRGRGGDRPPRREEDDRDFDWNSRRGPLEPSEQREQGGFQHRGGPRHNEEDDRDFSSWERKGPLAPIVKDDRDYSSWEHKGPLAPVVNKDKRDYGSWEHKGPPPSENHNRHGGGKFRSERKNSRDDVFDRDWNAEKPSEGVKTFAGGYKSGFKQKHGDTPAGEAGAEGDAAAPPKTGYKRLNLKPRTIPIGANNDAAPRSSALFGSAKPVDTASKYLEFEEREKKQREAHQKEAAEKQEAAAAEKARKQTNRDVSIAENGATKSFAALKLQDEEEKEEKDDEAVATTGRRKEEPTEAEKILSAEASKEELESDGWSVVSSSKRSGRR